MRLCICKLHWFGGPTVHHGTLTSGSTISWCSYISKNAHVLHRNHWAYSCASSRIFKMTRFRFNNENRIWTTRHPNVAPAAAKSCFTRNTPPGALLQMQPMIKYIYKASCSWVRMCLRPNHRRSADCWQVFVGDAFCCRINLWTCSKCSSSSRAKREHSLCKQIYRRFNISGTFKFIAVDAAFFSSEHWSF